MKRFGLVLLLLICLPVFGAAQERIVSPALDPGYVILKPSKEYYRSYINQDIGSGELKSLGPLVPNSPFSDVFIKGLDTFGFYQKPINVEHGVFRTGPTFLESQKSEFKLNTSYIVPVHNFGASRSPSLIASALYLYSPKGGYAFQSDTVRLAGKSFPLFKDHATVTSAYLDSDTLEDLLITEDVFSEFHRADVFYGKNLAYNGDTMHVGASVYKVIRADDEIAPSWIPRPNQLLDLDGDGIQDLIGFGVDKDTLWIRFGERPTDSTWGLESDVVYHLTEPIRSVHKFDFLRDDGVPDLIIGTRDTIYVFDGQEKQLFRSFRELSSATFKIPYPGKLDPKNFNGNGRGEQFRWGELVFDAGSVNGSCSHSLATLFMYGPDTASLYDIAYLFVYSGGLAADEKADAIFGDDDQESYFVTFDTVRTSLDGPSGFLLGSLIYALYHFQGAESIPHKTSSQWLAVSPVNFSKIELEVTNSSGAALITAPVGAEIIVRGLLGNEVVRAVSLGKTKVNLSSLPSGVYFVEATLGSRTSRPVRLLHVK